jgi:hypothetical protein
MGTPRSQSKTPRPRFIIILLLVDEIIAYGCCAGVGAEPQRTSLCLVPDIETARNPRELFRQGERVPFGGEDVNGAEH